MGAFDRLAGLGGETLNWTLRQPSRFEPRTPASGGARTSGGGVGEGSRADGRAGSGADGGAGEGLRGRSGSGRDGFGGTGRTPGGEVGGSALGPFGWHAGLSADGAAPFAAGGIHHDGDRAGGDGWPADGLGMGQADAAGIGPGSDGAWWVAGGAAVSFTADRDGGGSGSIDQPGSLPMSGEYPSRTRGPGTRGVNPAGGPPSASGSPDGRASHDADQAVGRSGRRARGVFPGREARASGASTGQGASDGQASGASDRLGSAGSWSTFGTPDATDFRHGPGTASGQNTFHLDGLTGQGTTADAAASDSVAAAAGQSVRGLTGRYPGSADDGAGSGTNPTTDGRRTPWGAGDLAGPAGTRGVRAPLSSAQVEQIDRAVRAELVLRGLVPENAATMPIGPGRTPTPHPTRVTIGIEHARDEGDLGVRIDRVVIVQPAPAVQPGPAAAPVAPSGPSDLARFLETRGGASR